MDKMVTWVVSVLIIITIALTLIQYTTPLHSDSKLEQKQECLSGHKERKPLMILVGKVPMVRYIHVVVCDQYANSTENKSDSND